MGLNSGGVLQLYKWDTSQAPLNLSEFREAFISPTRQLLVLLSYHSQALLLPLLEGKSVDFTGDNVSTSPRCGKTVPNANFSSPINSPRPSDNPFLWDVISLAWGVCGDSYDKHEESPFRELLFVCGSHGVTVHAFRQQKSTSTLVNHRVMDDIGEERWKEWGPHTTLNGEDPDGPSTDVGGNGSVRNVVPKRWLRTFLTKAETTKSDGIVWTKYPEEASYLSSASVVSFNIFDGTSSILDSFPCSSVLNKSEGFCRTTSSHCSKVFSSPSHHLIGFVVRLSSDNEESSQILLLVAKIGSYGIRWIFSVELDESVNGGTVTDWSDFGFSSNCLICLSRGGKVFFYDTVTGGLIANVNIAQIHGLHHQLSKEQEKMFMKGDLATTSVDTLHNQNGVNAKTYHVGDFFSKRTFKRLLISSHTSILSVVDEYGVIYVIEAADHLPAKYHTCEMQLPHFQHGLGVIVSWEIGGVDIGHQRGFSNFSDYSKETSVRSRSFSSVDCMNNCKLLGIQDIFIKKKRPHCENSGFSAASNLIIDKFSSDEISCGLARNVFLPTKRYCEDDIICFSPLGVTRLIRVKEKGCSQILHSSLYVDAAGDDYISDFIPGSESFIEEAVGCTLGGCFYLVTESGISVILPSVSVSSNFLPVEVIEYPELFIATTADHQFGDLFQVKDTKQPWSPWKVEVLDRALLYEGPEEVDRLCWENGWDLKIPRIRHLQLALYYLHFDEVERSLERLADVHLAEEGVLRLVFAAVFLVSHKHGNDIEISAASRLLAIATKFATKMIRKYGLIQLKEEPSVFIHWESENSPLPVLRQGEEDELGNSRRLQEMSHFLEIIRKLQCRLSAKYKRPGHGRVEDARTLTLVDSNFQQDFEASVILTDALSFESGNQQELSAALSNADFGNVLAIMSVDSLNSKASSDSATGLPVTLSDGNPPGKKSFPLENPTEMMNRWKIDNLDLKTIVKDALQSGRLPLAVLQLHLHGAREAAIEKEPHDTFSDVRNAGRAIAYDIFSEGDVELAVATLLKLGEDIETSLKELAFGTVRRSLRVQIAEELKRYGYLGPYEQKALESITFIERVYLCSSFWNAFHERLRKSSGDSSCDPEREVSVCLSYSHTFKDLIIHCGELDGVVLGSWINVSEDSVTRVSDEDNSHAAYWTAAAIWSDAWDQRTIDRVLLDQPLLIDVDVSWESRLEFHICHNNCEEVSKLLDAIPSYSSSDGMLQISLDGLQSGTGYGRQLPNYGNYICSLEEIDSVCMEIPNVQILTFPANNMCSMWLKTSMELQLASKFIFVKEYWEGTAEIMSLLARAGFISSLQNLSGADECGEGSSSTNMPTSKENSWGTSQAFHKLVVHHCVQYNLPNFLDLYLDQHKLGLDKDSVSGLLQAAGDSQWAKWLLLSRVKGLEYDSSFCNARSVASRNIVPVNNLTLVEINDIIRTVDDLAEAAGEMTALATLMYAPVPIQDCLSSGTVTRHSSSSSAQCTLENLRPALLHFPTLWRALVAACFGQDATCNVLSPKSKFVSGNSNLSDYLSWRKNIFFSSGRDTSLLQMLPCWFSKAVRRLIQFYMQGPLGWQSLAGLRTEEFPLQEPDLFVPADDGAEISALSWEAAIQKHVEEEMYASSLEENGLKLEYHLHRGRALAAFDQLLAVRVQKLKAESTRRGQPDTSHGQANVQADVQIFLAPITESEESLLSSVVPLAITHFEDSVLVSSCAFLLELCGLSSSMLRIDIAALRRISSFYKSNDYADHYKQLSPRGSVLYAESHDGNVSNSLARALADDYLHGTSPGAVKKKVYSNDNPTRQPSTALMFMLQHLEKASLPLLSNQQTCGSWLLNGNGDGAELRSQQKVASQHWNLVTLFCQMHQMSLSTKYLAVLARNDDWVGFLSEAQVGGYPFEIVVRVASKEFSDPRLRIHILTVLKGIQSRSKVSSSSASVTIEGSETSFMDERISMPVELFEILADCEKQKNPGEALLLKAKDMCWSILAMIASCFPDVSQLSCLTVWLEITAARETSSIKVNDIASKIANNVAAAVEATNSLPLSDREVTFHYNRRSPKRRRLMDPKSHDSITFTGSRVSITAVAKINSGQGLKVDTGFKTQIEEPHKDLNDYDEVSVSLSKMVAVLCEQHLFLPLLKAFEIFLPSCSLLPFIRALQVCYYRTIICDVAETTKSKDNYHKLLNRARLPVCNLLDLVESRTITRK